MRPLTVALAIVQNRRRAVPRPAWCTYLVSYRCNARCGMCDSWRMKPGYELTPAEVATVFGKIGRLEVVRLSGGEPFLREDFAEVAGAVFEKSSPGVLHVTTNGSFPHRIERFVADFPRPERLRFMVSFDGLEAEHDASRGADVTFRTAVEAVRRLARLRERYGLEVSANHTVISARSLADNDGLRRTLGQWDVDVHSVLAYADSAMYTVKLRGRRAEHLIVPTGYPLHPKLHGADALGFVDRELERVEQFRDPLMRIGKRYYLEGLRARLAKEPDPQPKPSCVALRSHIRLLPDGSVPVCQFNTERVGNLLRQSFDEVWHGPEIAPQRQWVDDCPGCWAECEVMPNALFTGDILRG
jgi:MoaA/NifB/PqqE/SkfB family radical SAM enzyme